MAMTERERTYIDHMEEADFYAPLLVLVIMRLFPNEDVSRIIMVVEQSFKDLEGDG